MTSPPGPRGWKTLAFFSGSAANVGGAFAQGRCLDDETCTAPRTLNRLPTVFRGNGKRLAAGRTVDPELLNRLQLDSTALRFRLDTVPDAGAYDGVLGVVLGVALLETLGGKRLPFGIEVVGFSEEEGVRFGAPFIGSRALVGRLDDELLEEESPL